MYSFKAFQIIEKKGVDVRGGRNQFAQACYKLLERGLIDEMRLHSDRFNIEPEITAKVLKRGIRIYEVPISYSGREFDEGKKITWRDGFSALWTLVKYRFRD